MFNKKIHGAGALLYALLILLTFGCAKSSDSAASTSTSTTCTLMGGKSTCALTLSLDVTTLAGDGNAASDDGAATTASFNVPRGITTDGTNLYVADTTNHRIRRIVIATGAVDTLAGDTSGFADNTGSLALFNSPRGITTDGTNLYVADTTNHRIRRIVIASGVVTTLAGNTSGFADNTGSLALFNSPQGITTDGTNLYVADTGNHRIRRIVIASGVVTTLAGGGSNAFLDDTGTAARFDSPIGITTDGTNLYVADRNNHRIRRIVIASSVVSTLAGDGNADIEDVPTANASFNQPGGITTDGTRVYVADSNNHRIRRIVIATGAVGTLAGNGPGFNDGSGIAALFNFPEGITTDGKSLFVADGNNHRIRRLR